MSLVSANFKTVLINNFLPTRCVGVKNLSPQPEVQAENHNLNPMNVRTLKTTYNFKL